jgi:hypothetical protein
MLATNLLGDVPRLYAVDAVAGLDLRIAAHRARARLRVAVDLSRGLRETTLIRVCRAHGLRHIANGVAAAHALARIAVPEPTSHTTSG